jgi:hypothetical protein
MDIVCAVIGTPELFIYCNVRHIFLNLPHGLGTETGKWHVHCQVPLMVSFCTLLGKSSVSTIQHPAISSFVDQ